MAESVQARSHICARPLQKATNDSDSSKEEVVGKKLLLLPNFDKFKHGVVTRFHGSPPAAVRTMSLTVDCPSSNPPYLSHRSHTNWILMYFSYRGEKTADGARFSPTARPTCPPSCFKHPGEATSNVKYCACPSAFKEFPA